MKSDTFPPSWLLSAEYSFQSNFFAQSGAHQHFLDEGQGQVMLFVHGTPSWSFDFRHLIRHFKGKFRCLAIDHLGFGLSDKPRDYAYSTLRHSENLKRFILDKDLWDITMVVHDFGGPIGLNVAIQHPERFKRLIVLNSWLWSSEGDAEFEKLKKVLHSPVLPLLYKYLNFSAAYVLPRSFGDRKLPKSLLSQYTKPLGTATERLGALAFARSLRDDQDWFESLWRRRIAIQHLPTLFIWGMKDPFIKQRHLRKFESGFPLHHTVEMSTVGHFPQEEAPKEIISEMEKWLRETPVLASDAARR